jgi:hypothetical protein
MRIVRIAALVALALIGLVTLLRWVVAGGRVRVEAPGRGPPRSGSRHSAELRCETHGLTVRLEADGSDEFERSRMHLRCPLCAEARS